jgi:hypothetical protein
MFPIPAFTWISFEIPAFAWFLIGFGLYPAIVIFALLLASLHDQNGYYENPLGILMLLLSMPVLICCSFIEESKKKRLKHEKEKT